MAGADSPELAEARADVDKAIRHYADVRAAELGHNDVYVTAWAGYAEYVNGTMLADEQSATVAIIPDDQPAVTSRGLYEYGTDTFRRN